MFCALCLRNHLDNSLQAEYWLMHDPRLFPLLMIGASSAGIACLCLAREARRGLSARPQVLLLECVAPLLLAGISSQALWLPRFFCSQGAWQFPTLSIVVRLRIGASLSDLDLALPMVIICGALWRVPRLLVPLLNFTPLLQAACNRVCTVLAEFSLVDCCTVVGALVILRRLIIG